MSRVAWAMALLLAGWGGPIADSAGEAQGAAAEQSSLAELERARLHSLRLRVDPVDPADPASCGSLDVGDLKVSLRGQRVDESLMFLDRRPRPNVHALLIDTSRSMLGHLDQVREVAAGYVRRLRSDELGLVATFDETVVLHQGATHDRVRLEKAVNGLRMSSNTSLLDGLVYTFLELEGHRERPVVLLLTDGLDSSSLNERHDVFELARRRPDLMVFTIGLNLPPLVSGGPSGVNSTGGFLQRLAARTDGRFFGAPTPSRLPAVYARIREMLDNEMTLEVVDPDPDAKPGRPRVSSLVPGCRVERIGRPEEDAPDGARLTEPFDELPQRLTLFYSSMWDFHLNRAHHVIDPACESPEEGVVADRERLAESVWFAALDSGDVRGCALDLAMETGILYDPLATRFVGANSWIKLSTRPFHVPAPRLETLPRRPSEILEALAAHAVEVADDDVETDPRKRPAEWHARPYVDYPELLHGRTFLEIRPRIAHALFLKEDYRQWTLAKLEEESRQDLARLKQAFRRRAPGASDAELAAAVRESPEGRSIVERARAPREADLQRHLAAWLGDVPAHELFVSWESDRLDDYLASGDASNDPAFLDRWRELRRVFFAPSYARVLAPLTLVHDPLEDRIGFYRVILPRPGWFGPRVRGYEKHPEWTDLPLDLLPDLPLGYWTVSHLITAEPQLGSHLRKAEYRVESLRYELLTKSGRHRPNRAFGRTHLRVELTRRAHPSGGDTPATLVIEADVALDRKQRPKLETRRLVADGDGELETLAAKVGKVR